MHQLRRHHEVEYRARSGEDLLGRVDIWTDVAAARAVLVLRDLLCNLLSIDDALRLETRKLVHDIAFLDTIPY